VGDNARACVYRVGASAGCPAAYFPTRSDRAFIKAASNESERYEAIGKRYALITRSVD
jgi:hypothetical protein